MAVRLSPQLLLLQALLLSSLLVVSMAEFLSSAQKKELLNAHNRFRRSVKPTATNMIKLVRKATPMYDCTERFQVLHLSHFLSSFPFPLSLSRSLYPSLSHFLCLCLSLPSTSPPPTPLPLLTAMGQGTSPAGPILGRPVRNDDQ